MTFCQFFFAKNSNLAKLQARGFGRKVSLFFFSNISWKHVSSWIVVDEMVGWRISYFILGENSEGMETLFRVFNMNKNNKIQLKQN